MNTLNISKTLQASGMEPKQSEAVAQTITEAVEEHSDKLATKRDLYFLGAVMVAGFGYIVATQNTIINAITLIS